MKFLNEYFQPLNEDIRFEALSMLRETQASLVGISFLPVIAIMKEENPLKKDVLKFQDDLDELTMRIQNFISKAKNDVEYIPEDPEAPAEDEVPEKPEEDDEKPEEDDETPEDDEKNKKSKDSKEVEDSSEPKE